MVLKHRLKKTCLGVITSNMSVVPNPGPGVALTRDPTNHLIKLSIFLTQCRCIKAHNILKWSTPGPCFVSPTLCKLNWTTNFFISPIGAYFWL